MHLSPHQTCREEKTKNKQRVLMMGLRKSLFNPHFIKFSCIQQAHGYTHRIGFSSSALARSVPELPAAGCGDKPGSACWSSLCALSVLGSPSCYPLTLSKQCVGSSQFLKKQQQGIQGIDITAQKQEMGKRHMVPVLLVCAGVETHKGHDRIHLFPKLYTFFCQAFTPKRKGAIALNVCYIFCYLNSILLNHFSMIAKGLSPVVLWLS